MVLLGWWPVVTDLVAGELQVGASVDSSLAVDVQGLTKRYGGLTAVDGIDFSVGQGEVFAFLGPNGAGKSTTIKMLCTLARPTSGRATVAGFDVASEAKSVRRTRLPWPHSDRPGTRSSAPRVA